MIGRAAFCVEHKNTKDSKLTKLRAEFKKKKKKRKKRAPRNSIARKNSYNGNNMLLTPSPPPPATSITKQQSPSGPDPRLSNDIMIIGIILSLSFANIGLIDRQTDR